MRASESTGAQVTAGKVKIYIQSKLKFYERKGQTTYFSLRRTMTFTAEHAPNF